MPTRTSRRALAAVAVVLVLGVGGPLASAPTGAQEEPVPSTEVVPTSAVEDPATSTTAAEGGDDAGDAAVEEAQEQADADLRSVWIIVAALGAVAFGLLVLLVLYVRATNPERAARRRAELIARAEERRRARGERVDDDDDDFRPFAAADEPAAADGEGERTELVGAVAPAGAATLSRDPDGADDDAVRVLGAPVAAAPGTPAVPEATSPPVTTGSGAGTRRRTRPPAPRPAGGPGPAGPPPGPAEGDETVRIVPAPSGPAAVPASAGRGAVVATGPAATGDRPPPRSLVDSPPPTRRPRRVEAPAKKLGTPDAERVLVRPGQKPVRVPPSLAKPGTAGSPADVPPNVPADAPAAGDDAPAEEPGR